MGDTTPDLRVGDRERRAVDDRLLAAVGDGVLTLHEYEERSGVLWRTRTRSELDALVADLPGPPAPAAGPGPAAPAALPPQRSPHLPTPHRGVHGSGLRTLLQRAGGLLVPAAVLGGVLLAGPDSAAVFGSDVVRVQPGDDRISVSTLFGSVQVVVPDDASVTRRGLMVFGSTECDDACGNAGEEAVQVRRIGAFGSVEILTESEYRAEQAEDAREDRLDEAEERREDAED